ncbi:hypothetical protein J7T55_001450 [Diaporthe amygdali]|uniref:uncharacterized protein n=1 Tax=Phomopsis amygdali TaxID=1214568 RepID=UPI0022FF3355|nr:uncharacterized protein J7T55_001450 [Diaporthe amygdali]KAJ0115042.1 hypothetical protein J7T55_001450 [Diaporthe amygdali]
MKQASVQFLKGIPLYEEEKPFQIFGDLLPDATDQRKTNLVWEEKQIPIRNIRDDAQGFQLDSHGFTTRRLPGFTDLLDRETITGKYIPAIKDMLKTELQDVGTVFVFDWRIRESRNQMEAGSKINFGDQTQPLLPSNYAHVDTSPISVIQRIRESFPNDSGSILRQRVRAVNVWKPLANPVDEWALAVCDGTSVNPDDLAETDSIRQGNITTHYYVRYDAGQRWYFLDRQTPDEALIFKHFDSKPDALHSSIKQLWTEQDPKPRRSIEVRTLIFSDVVDVP